MGVPDRNGQPRARPNLTAAARGILHGRTHRIKASRWEPATMTNDTPIDVETLATAIDVANIGYSISD